MTRDTFPQEVVRSGGLGNFQTVDLDVGEWINFLQEVKVNEVAEV
jgi:hypothetical protein